MLTIVPKNKSNVTLEIERAIAITGSLSELARRAVASGYPITKAAIHYCIIHNWCGPKVAIAVENATGGKVKRSALRPDMWKPRKARNA